jgi:hypothetical protein
MPARDPGYPTHLYLPDGTIPCPARGSRLYVTPYESEVTCLGCQLWMARKRVFA